MYRWINQKHLNLRTVNYAKRKKILYDLYIDSKRNKKIWNYFQKYYKNLIQKDYTPPQHILTISDPKLRN